MSPIPGGIVHPLPKDLQKALEKDKKGLAAWLDITPLARNEWICWVESAKLIETRQRRVQRAHTELAQGKRRPCCWAGCFHRTDKELSLSQKWVLSKTKTS